MELINCEYCNSLNDATGFNLFTDDEINKIISDIYSGKITIESLDVASYNKVAEKLTSGVYEGFGKNLINISYGTPDAVMLTSLRENVYIFSAAKSYQQTREISALILDENGNKRNFNQFSKLATKEFETYNKHHLNAEYNSAIAQGRAASLWQDIEETKSTYNQLQYQTIGDGRVRPEHRVLDGIIRPVDDKWWNIFFPPCGWSCRCTVLQTFDEPNTVLSTRTKPTEKEVPEIFRFNAGKDKIIYSPKHPYFDVAKADRELAKNNFNLPLPNAN